MRNKNSVGLPLWQWDGGSNVYVEKAAVALLLFVFLALGAYYALNNPLFSKPDESYHYAYAIYLHAGHGLPVIDTTHVGPREHTALELEGHQPPLYYATVAFVAKLLGFYERITLYPATTCYVPSPAFFPVFFTGRFVSLLSGALAIVCGYSLVRLFAPWPLAWLSAAWMGFNPQFLFIATSFSNDMASVATVHLGLWWMGRGIRSGLNFRYGVVFGLIVALATLTKLTGLGLMVPLGLVALAQAWRRKSIFPLLAVGVAGMIVIIADGWWFWRNLVLYGNPFATNLLKVLLGSRTTPWSPAETRFFFETLWKSYWLDFSSGGALFAEREVYFILGSLLILSVLGVAVALRQEAPLRPLFLLTWGWFAVVFASFLRLTRDTAVFMGGGRLLFPAAIAVATTIAVGLATIFRKRLVIPAIIALLFSVYAAIAPGRYFPSYPYSLRYLVASDSSRSLHGAPNDLWMVGKAFQNGLQLAGYKMNTGDLRKGTEIQLSLYWRVESYLKQRYRVFVQLGPRDPTRYVAGQDVLLGDEIYPSEIWQKGEIVRQFHRLSIPDWAPAPGLYWIRLGLVDENGHRIPLKDGSGDTVVLGPWRLTAPTPPSPPTYRSDYSLGEAIHLDGYDVAWEGEGTPSSLTVTLHWRATQVPTGDYTVFVHLLDGEGNLVSQHDGPPRGGEYPTSWWRVGERVVDVHVLPLEQWDGGPLFLRVGMYHPETLERLPVYDHEGHRVEEDSIRLPEVMPGEKKGLTEGAK